VLDMTDVWRMWRDLCVVQTRPRPGNGPLSMRTESCLRHYAKLPTQWDRLRHIHIVSQGVGM